MNEEQKDDKTAFLWRWMPLRVLLAAIPSWFTLAILVFSVPWRVKLIVGAIAGMTFVSPVYGLLAIAAVTPLGELLGMVAHVEQFRMSEAVVLAFLSTFILRVHEERRGPRIPRLMAATGWLFGVVIVVSIGIASWRLSQFPGELSQTADVLFQAYYLGVDNIGVVDGARLMEGLALVAATVMLFRRRPGLAVTLPVALGLSATVAAASSLLLWHRIGPTTAMTWLARIGSRVSGHIPDVNAAGSYFAMIFCFSVGMAARPQTRRRWSWMIGAILTGLGLWLTDSRSAIATTAVIAALAISWALTSSWRPSLRAGMLLVLLLAVLSAGAVGGRGVEREHVDDAVAFRREFNATSLRMVAERPFFGVGVGQYYQTSTLFLSPRLGWFYGFENAHNFFLQVAAELGVPGLVLFASWLAIGLGVAIRALTHSPRDPRLLGATAGVITLIGTCLTGHPLLIDEVAYPFWMLFGLTIALSGSTLLNANESVPPTSSLAAARRMRSRVLPLALAAVVGFLLIGGLGRARLPIDPPDLRAVDGFYGWETASDGSRFRWTELYASLFVPADVTRVHVPVRIPGSIPTLTPMGIEVRVGGIRHGRTLVGDSWADLNVVLPDAGPPTRFKRIDLKVDRTWQPALYVAGSADLRAVGVQVGECQVFREH